MQRKCVIVLGMHRSGTSAVSGVLTLLGIDPGESLLPAVEDVNPKGFWEHAEIVSIHDQLLESLGSSWDDEDALPEEWLRRPLVTDLRDQIVKVLRRDFASTPIWLIKDPRICRLLPLWREVLQELSCQPLFILALRDPVEVAQSLCKRDNLAEATSCLLWLTHMLEAEYQTRGQPRAFIEYEHLLSDWRGAVADISQALSLAWPINVEDAAPDIDKFLDPALRHYHSHTIPSDNAACRLAREGFELLSAPSPDTAKLDHLRATWEVASLVAPYSKRFRASKKHNQELCATIARLESEKVALETASAALQGEIMRIKRTASWQITKPLRLIWNMLVRPAWNRLTLPPLRMRRAARLLSRIIWNTLLRLSGRQPQGTMSMDHPRAIMAKHHLHGEGIEIGAMHFPVWRHSNLKVKYVDNTSRKDSIKKFPEIRASSLVNPDYIEDGFTLSSLPDSSQDFLIANHVLEHAPNPLRVLTNWARVLRPGGSMLLTVPVAETCFDRGRPITSLEHMVGDYQADPLELNRRNLDHYLEWLSISEPVILAMNGQRPKEETAAERKARAADMCRANSEIHFHTFSADSFRQLLEFFSTSLDGRFAVTEVRDAGGEVIAVISRK